MALNNLIVSYELLAPHDSEGAVLATLRQLGACTRVRGTLWHVKSALGAAQVADRLREILSGTDNVIVFDATANQAAWYNLERRKSAALREQWNRT